MEQCRSSHIETWSCQSVEKIPSSTIDKWPPRFYLHSVEFFCKGWQKMRDGSYQRRIHQRKATDCIIQGRVRRDKARARLSLWRREHKNNFETAATDIRAREKRNGRKGKGPGEIWRGARKVFCLWQPRPLQPRTNHPARSTGPFHSCLKPSANVLRGWPLRVTRKLSSTWATPRARRR